MPDKLQMLCKHSQYWPDAIAPAHSLTAPAFVRCYTRLPQRYITLLTPTRFLLLLHALFLGTYQCLLLV